MRRKLNQKGLVGGLILGAIGVGAIGFLGYRYFITGETKAFTNLLRDIGIFFDVLFYGLASRAYSLFYEVSSSSLLSSMNLASASQRIYTLLGIFMLFRLAFSFVKYIINPEGMEKGTSKLLSNLAVSLALIVSVPWIFNRAFELQNYIMESNVIGNLIMGMDTSSAKNKNGESINASSYGQVISFLTFSAFYRVDSSSVPSFSSCANLLTYYSENVVPDGDKSVKFVDNSKLSDAERKENQNIAACVNALNSDSSIQNISDAEIGTILYIASQRYDIGLLTNSAILHAVLGSYHVINYMGFISTIAGGFLAWLFLCFTFDVAVRNAKLCFLQLIAPIPIILNIEPGDGKKDSKPLNWWTKECLKTYTLLFIRVATVYFGVFLINMLFLNSSGMSGTSFWFQVFTILGILLFVKEIPDMIGKAFGIDVKGQFNLNPLKRIGDSRIASMAVGGALGLAGGLGTGIAAGVAAKRNGAGVGESIRRGLTGGVGGALHSGWTGAKKGAKSIHDITGNVRENLARSGRIGGANVGTTIAGRTGARVSMAMGAPTAADIIQTEAKAAEEYGNAFGNMKSFALTSKENVGINRFSGGGYSVKAKDAAGLDFYINDLKNQIANTSDDSARKRLTSELKRVSDRNFRSAFLTGASEETLSMGNTTGDSYGNVKDANDHLERLRASGASESDIKAAEDMVSQFVNNYIDVYKGVSGHAINTMWTNTQDTYERHKDVFNQYGVSMAETAAELKASITPAKSAAYTHKNSRAAQDAERTNAAVKANKGGK